MGTEKEVRMGGSVIGRRIGLGVKIVLEVIKTPDGDTGSMWPVRLEVIKCPRIKKSCVYMRPGSHSENIYSLQIMYCNCTAL